MELTPHFFFLLRQQKKTRAELYIFMLYVFQCLFEVRVSREQAEQLFQLMDSTARGEVNYGELVMFIVAINPGGNGGGGGGGGGGRGGGGGHV